MVRPTYEELVAALKEARDTITSLDTNRDLEPYDFQLGELIERAETAKLS